MHKILKKNLKNRLFFLSILLLSPFFISAQTLSDVDSLLIDRDLENYSVRLFTNFKVKKFSIKNSDAKAKYVPNNRYGLGFGFASKKIIVDLAFNVKNKNKAETKRFDLQATTIVKKRHLANVFVQTYKGFKAKNNFGEPVVFRNDIKSATVGFNYLYLLDNVEFSYSQLKAGLTKQRNHNVYITGGVGFFGVFDYFSAKPNLFPETSSIYFNEQANIKRYKGAAVGVLAGVVTYFKLPENITATFNITPGIALSNKRLILDDGSYKPEKPILYKLDFLMGLTYSFKRYYVSLSYGNGFYSTDLGYNNNYFFNLTNAKLAIGYKLK